MKSVHADVTTPGLFSSGTHGMAGLLFSGVALSPKNSHTNPPLSVQSQVSSRVDSDGLVVVLPTGCPVCASNVSPSSSCLHASGHVILCPHAPDACSCMHNP